MIFGNLKDIAEQLPPSTALQQGMEFLRSSTWAGHPDGRVDIAGDEAYALFQSYDTAPVAEVPQLEAHYKYIDLQYIIEGEEVIGWAPIDQLVIETPYDEKTDIWFGSLPRAKMTPLYLTPGQVAVFYPSDGHLPKRNANGGCPVRKIVAKVAVGK
jgi:YhcH/YjgK/YiaL family protein